ncbi:restriction endonuclease subunit S [Idiomarina loihiensis]|uniref:restriction endonuclease subunit S n=1 Tax=Idiomarina loihiensis TaxID=135577 RepID=UPI00129D0467|nr:restriction endonuclease subunit S [Idiomarina loihiensis]MRJ45753.1 hypothetical protein [Idiomarina loihiensis]UTW32805.1 restriction endonuclease subunit S [Idiomarina loihiensis]
MSMPAQWEYIELKDLLSFVLGGDWGKEATFSDDDYELAYCIRGTEFKNWKSEKGLTSVQRKIKKSSLEKRRLREGDILVEISGGGPDQPVGRTVLIDKKVLSNASGYPKVCTNFIRLTRPSDKVDSRYLNYYLNYFYLTGEVINYQGGSNNLRNLKYKEYEKIKIPVALLSSQVEIADKLDTIMEKVEMAQSRLDKIPTLLKRFRMSVLSAAVSGELTEEWRENLDNLSQNIITPKYVENDAYDVWDKTTKLTLPHTWVYCKLHELGEVKGGGTPRKSVSEYWDGNIPWVTPKDMKINYIHTSKLLITSKGVDESSAKLIDEQSILFVVRGMILAHSFPVALNTNKVTINQDMKSITPVNGVDSEYLLYAFKSLESVFVGLTSSSTHGTKRLEAKIYNNVGIAIPPENEQIEIVHRIKSFFELVDSVERQYREAKRRVDKLSQSILARAFRGELFEPFSDKPRNEPTEVSKIDEQPSSTAVEDVVEPTEQPTKTSGTSTKRTPEIDDKSPIFQLLKKNKNGMTAQQLFSDIADNTFSVIDELFVELKRLLESELITKVGEGAECSFKVGKK